MTARARTIAIVVNWNGGAATERCVGDLAGSRAAVDVLVVDNGSRDDDIERLRRLDARRVEILPLPGNRGFGAALNAAIAHVGNRGYEFAWMLNNDLRIPPDCHERLLQAADEDRAPTVLTPDLVSETGRPQHIGGVWADDGSSARLVAAADAAVASDGFWLSGTALFCALTTMARIGPFDESFFAYWEDVDWSFRAARAGVRLGVASGATVTHLGTQASGGRGSALSTFLLARNEIRIVRLHVPEASRRAALLRVVARQVRWALLLERRGGREQAGMALAGLVAGLAGQRGPARIEPLPADLATRILAHALALAHRLERAADWRSRPGNPERQVAPVDPEVSVCIVSFNTRDLLRACLQSVAAATRRRAEIIVVDNASGDGSADMVAHEFPGVRLVRSATNVGFAAAANVAMREARGQMLLLLNPDTLVPDGGIDGLIAFLDEHASVDACGPMLVYPGGRFQCCGYRFPSLLSELRDAIGDWWLRGPLRRWRSTRPVASAQVDWLCGACMLVRRTAIDRVGLFDEQFVLYGEELDWFARAQAAGVTTWRVPSVEVVHHLGQSASTVRGWANAQLVQTRVLYFRKHHGRASALVVRLLFALRSLAGR